MTISKQSALLSRCVIAAALIFFAASYFLITLEMTGIKRGMEDAFAGQGEAAALNALNELNNNLDACLARVRTIMSAAAGLAVLTVLGYTYLIKVKLLRPLKEISGAADAAGQALSLVKLEAQPERRLPIDSEHLVSRFSKAAEGIAELNSQITALSRLAVEIKTAALQAGRLASAASAEAGPAGEWGRGVSAFAEALASLTGRAAEAASQIETIAAEAVKISEEQSALAEETRETFSAMLSALDMFKSETARNQDLSDKAAAAIDKLNRKITV